MERRNGWTILESEVKYQNPWIQVVEHQVIRPNGEPGIYGVLDAGNNAAAVVMDDDFNIVILDEFIFPMNTRTPQIPSGQFREEDPLHAAKRELLEETGITANHWVDLGTFYLSGGISTQIGHIFLARDLTYGESELEVTEQLTWRKIPLREAANMCLNAEIKDSVSVVGILRAELYLRQET